jgi:GNAT superfamily N-acetyltransferase
MPKTVIIRLMKPEESDEVPRLFHDIWHETQARLQDPRQARARPLAFFRKRIELHAATTLVATSSAVIAGFACWTDGTLNSLFVRDDHRDHGLGEDLCRYVELEMARTGAPQFELDCICGNQAGRRFYERFGWRVSHTETLENETPEGLCQTQAWRMVKP